MIFLKRLFSAVLLILMCWILYVTFPVWSSIFASTSTTFTPENWRNAHMYRREVMARDFLDRHPHVGMPQEVITHLLGRPDQQSAGALHYFVAITAADYIALSFEIDGDGCVVKAYLRQT
jgi:hypothetical protein